MEFEFVDPRRTPFVDPNSRGELPHLYKEGGSYFVTFRLLEAVVLATSKERTSSRKRAEKRSLGNGNVLRAGSDIQIHGRLRASPAEEVARIACRSEPQIQRGGCVLREPCVASIVEDALRHFDGQRYMLSAWCVMPNHVHVVFTIAERIGPTEVLRSWKSFTAHKMNKVLNRSGPIWERESFDHLIRSLEHFEAFVQYIENNPVVAGLCEVPEDWPWSSARIRGRKS